MVNYRGYKGDTALHIATRKRELDWVGYLLKKGADPNIGDAKGDTALMIAARIGFEEAADWMVRLGAKVDAANRRGETALIIAVQQRQPRVVERLLLKPGPIPTRPTMPPATPLATMPSATPAIPAAAEADRDGQDRPRSRSPGRPSTRRHRPATGRSGPTAAAPHGGRSAASRPCAWPAPAAGSTVPA